MEHLIIYHTLLEDRTLYDFYQLKTLETESPSYKDLYYGLIRDLKLTGQSIKDRLFDKMIMTEHPILTSIQNGDNISESDINCLRHDLSILKEFIKGTTSVFIEAANDQYQLFEDALIGHHHPVKQFYDQVLENYNGRDIHDFLQLIRTHGTGQFALKQAFYLSDDLTIKPIASFAPLAWEQIYGYQREKDKLLQNTKAFINGLPCHHALLVGASGTGKSSSVKAVIKYLEKEGLRLVQMTKNQLKDLPLVMKQLSKSPFKFILFIDDLSFEVNEDDYKFMKSFIEGGITNEASNVLFYITSNRRHLIKEIRSERENDIHLNDFIQEMTSLSDRFGLTLFFQAPEQALYYEMVLKMLGNKVTSQNEEDLLLDAKRWSLRHGGMSGRVAEQFVKHMIMTQHMNS